MDLRKKRIHFLLFLIGIVALSITAEKCRQMVGEEASSQSSIFTFLTCFDMSTGSLACAIKQGVKLYVYNMRSAHVERARHKAIETALADAMSQGMSPQEAAKLAQKEGVKAAKIVTRKAKRIIGPIISSGWDFFEVMYYGGTLTEGFLRGTGSLFGTYYIGFLGEQRLGRFGYLVGSFLGSWVGGQIGFMAYDVVNGVHFLLQTVQVEGAEARTASDYESSEVSKDSYGFESPASESTEASSEQSNAYEAPAEESPSYEDTEKYVNTELR